MAPKIQKSYLHIESWREFVWVIGFIVFTVIGAGCNQEMNVTQTPTPVRDYSTTGTRDRATVLSPEFTETPAATMDVRTPASDTVPGKMDRGAG